MTDNKGHQEKERLLVRETKEGSLKEAVALGIGLGGWLAFRHLPRAGRDQQKETLHSANLLAGGGMYSEPSCSRTELSWASAPAAPWLNLRNSIMARSQPRFLLRTTLYSFLLHSSLLHT